MANSECTHMRVGKEPCVACGGKRESNTKDPSTLDKAFSAGWDLISKKSWDGLSDDEGWTKNPLQCRNCGKKMTDAEWEQKTCECGTKNTVHPSMR